MTLDFDAIFDRVIGVEGGYVNDPRDPGGETNWGISKHAYPDVDIKHLTRDGAKAIYQRDYWPLFATMPPAIGFQGFDFAANSGLQAATRALQRAVGVVDDGHWGPVSQAALAAHTPAWVICRLLAERLELMTWTVNWITDGKGWARRIAGNLRDAAADTA